LLSMRGQVDERVRFYANTFDGTVFVALNGEIVYVLPKYEIAMKETLVGVKTVEIKGEDDAGTMINYFKGMLPQNGNLILPHTVWRVLVEYKMVLN